MATGKNGSFNITGKNGFTGRIIWSETYDISSNTSTLSLDLQIKSATYFSASGNDWRTYYPDGTIKVDGAAALSMSSTMGTHNVNFPVLNTWYDVNGNPSLPVSYGPITHNADGSKSVSIALYVTLATIDGIGGHGSKISGAQTITLTQIPRQATLSTAPNFNDEANPTITYSNPAGNAVEALEACISLTGAKDDIAYRAVPKTGTSYTFPLTEAERNVLRNATPNSNTLSVRFYLQTTIGGTVYRNYLTRTLTIVNGNPTLTATVTDSNSATTALTGDANKLVKYYSNATATASYGAVKGASVSSYQVTNGGQTLSAIPGTFNAVENGTFTFKVTDSRGNETTQPVTKPLIDYVKLSCNLGNNKPDTSGNMEIIAAGNYYNGSFGAVANTLTVQYRYKESGGSYGDWINLTATASGNTYSATGTLTGLDYRKSYVFQARAIDKLATETTPEYHAKTTPVFDWGENDFAFRVPVNMNGNKVSGLPTPTESADAVPKSYIDSAFPPLDVGVEYPTLERWMDGRILYTKRVDCGSMTNGMRVKITTDGGGAVRYVGVIGYNAPLDASEDVSLNFYFHDGIDCEVLCASTHEGLNLQIQVWYYKW